MVRNTYKTTVTYILKLLILTGQTNSYLAACLCQLERCCEGICHVVRTAPMKVPARAAAHAPLSNRSLGVNTPQIIKCRQWIVAESAHTNTCKHTTYYKNKKRMYVKYGIWKVVFMSVNYFLKKIKNYFMLGKCYKMCHSFVIFYTNCVKRFYTLLHRWRMALRYIFYSF